jgi:type IV secretion system protein VirB4
LPTTFDRWSQLRRWLKATDKHTQGEYAYLFDNAVDTLAFHQKMGFDMTHFLDNEPSSIRTAVMMYIMHRLKLSMDGTLLSIYLDEGWQYLQDEYWIKQLKTDFPTLRKNNAHIVFATQSPASVAESPLRHVILDNIATQIFFSNPQAKPEHYLTGFNLSEEEFEAIKQTEPSQRLFLIKQQTTSALCRLNLATLPQMLAVLSGNLKNIATLEGLLEERGEDPAQWLPYFMEKIE